MDLEITIINLISQISMSIWLYNDGQIVVASTSTASAVAMSSSSTAHTGSKPAMSARATSATLVVGMPALASLVDVVLTITTSCLTNALSAASDAGDEGGWTASGSTMSRGRGVASSLSSVTNVHAGGGGGGGEDALRYVAWKFGGNDTASAIAALRSKSSLESMIALG